MALSKRFKAMQGLVEPDFVGQGLADLGRSPRLVAQTAQIAG